MKKTFMIACFLFPVTVFAQKMPEEGTLDFTPKLFFNNGFDKAARLYKPGPYGMLPDRQANAAKPVKPKVFSNNGLDKSPGVIIPRHPGTYDMWPDNMPCVVPDLAAVIEMPNSVTPATPIPDMPNGLKRPDRNDKARKNTH